MYIYIYIHTYVCIYVYIYVYREREICVVMIYVIVLVYYVWFSVYHVVDSISWVTGSSGKAPHREMPSVRGAAFLCFPNICFTNHDVVTVVCFRLVTVHSINLTNLAGLWVGKSNRNLELSGTANQQLASEVSLEPICGFP